MLVHVISVGYRIPWTVRCSPPRVQRELGSDVAKQFGPARQDLGRLRSRESRRKTPQRLARHRQNPGSEPSSKEPRPCRAARRNHVTGGRATLGTRSTAARGVSSLCDLHASIARTLSAQPASRFYSTPRLSSRNHPPPRRTPSSSPTATSSLAIS